MSDGEVMERFCAFFFPAMEETFEAVHGIYLDKGTSLLETLARLTPEQASQANGPEQSTIAAQVEHVCFYIEVLESVLDGKPAGPVDWKEIWRRRAGVTADEWTGLLERLRGGYGRVMERARRFDWRGEEEISGAMAVLVHSAYHLGGLRMAIGAVTRRG